MDVRSNSRMPTLASSTITAVRGRRIGRSTSKWVGTNRKTNFPKKYSISLNKQANRQGSTHAQVQDRGCHGTSVRDIRPARATSPLVRDVRSEQDRNADRGRQTVRGASESCGNSFRLDCA